MIDSREALAVIGSVMVLLPDGFDDVMNAEKRIEGRDITPLTDADRQQFVRGLFYAYLRDVNPAYAQRFMEVNRERS